MVTATLLCHPVSRCPSITNFSARLETLGSDRLLLQMHIDGSIESLLIPADPHAGRALVTHGAAKKTDEAAQPGSRSVRQDGLWKHTCFEVFLRADDAAYCEFNFSPAGDWAAYGFTGYRKEMKQLAVEAPRIECQHNDSHLDIMVDFHLAAELGKLAGSQRRPLAVSLTAVIEDRTGKLSYWALNHVGPKPDFHHPDSFTAHLADLTAV